MATSAAVTPSLALAWRGTDYRGGGPNHLEMVFPAGFPEARKKPRLSSLNRQPSRDWGIEENDSILVDVSSKPHLPRAPTHDCYHLVPVHRLPVDFGG